MEFFSSLADKYHKQYKPKHTEDGEMQEKIDWEDYNYPQSWPLFYIESSRIKDEKSKKFFSVGCNIWMGDFSGFWKGGGLKFVGLIKLEVLNGGNIYMWMREIFRET